MSTTMFGDSDTRLLCARLRQRLNGAIAAAKEVVARCDGRVMTPSEEYEFSSALRDISETREALSALAPTRETRSFR